MDRSGIGRDNSNDCILVDSVPSQANRLEEHALRCKAEFGLPDIKVHFNGLEGEDSVSVFQAPHRVFDALLMGSELEGVPFRRSEVGQRLINVTVKNANALLKHALLTLLLGGWDSRRKNGAFRLAGALTLELLAVDAQVGVTSESRIDPKGIISQA